MQRFSQMQQDRSSDDQQNNLNKQSQCSSLYLICACLGKLYTEFLYLATTVIHQFKENSAK